MLKYLTHYLLSSWKSVLLSSVLATFPPSFIGEECLNILEVILTLETNMGEILRNLGLCLIIVEPQHGSAKDIWYKVWPQIKKIPNRDSYLSCCVVWVEFVVKNFGVCAHYLCVTVRRIQR